MKALPSYLRTGIAILAFGLTLAAQAKIIVVNTTNHVAAAGQVNLAGAITQLEDGDTIQFNIPGNGPHYLVSPPGGYPRITKNNVTLDGYSQPGAAPNTNPILAPNNAKIRIVLDARNGNFTDMAYEPENNRAGFGPGEVAVLGIHNAKNVSIKGFCLLGVSRDGHYGIAISRNFADGTIDVADGAHISGCWIGVDLDGKTVSGFADGIAAFRHRDDAIGNNARLPSNGHIIGVREKSENPRAEFNVIVGGSINIIVEGQRHRISGNFLGVLPNGMDDYIVPFAEPGRIAESHIEIGRGGSNLVIGTDGDGVNDADERNVMGGVVTNNHNSLAGANNLNGYRHVIEIYSLSSSPGPERTMNRIAGNYIGVAIDGMKRFTNGVAMFNGSAVANSVYWIGADMDGVSDEIEGNVVYNNFPPGLFYTDTAYNNAPTLGYFDEPNNGAFYSFRGNVSVNNYPWPVNPGRDGGAFLKTYMTKVLENPDGSLAPVLSTNDSTAKKLVGTVPKSNTDFPTVMIDIYQADPEGMKNGKVVADEALPNGWVQGRRFLGTFVDNGPDDANKTAGAFEFDLTKIGFGGGTLTVTANYSSDPPRTRNARVLTGPFSNPISFPFIPGGVASAKSSYVVRDKVIFDGPDPNLDNWEPFTASLGTSTFIIEANTFAEGTSDMQRYALAFQPAAGGEAKLGEVFFADDGKPYKGQINGSRQNGNPGRVAADQRPGAVNFIAGGEASPHAFPQFQSDNRWKTGVFRDEFARYASVQTYALDPATLTQKPLTKAFDAINGRLTAGDPATSPEVGRFGGDLAALDNGNFVIVADDRSNFHAGNRAATAVIVAPDGKIVKESFAVAEGQIWANVAAYQGGFAVRVNATLHFFDNAGTLKGTVAQSEGLPAGVAFDGGRGDGTRLAGHINSPYVFLSGTTSTEITDADGFPLKLEIVRIAAWDSRTQKLVAVSNVSELAPDRGGNDAVTFNGDFDRVNLAVDALNRVTVAYEARITDWEAPQIVARVLAFNPGARSFSPLTPSFFPHVNVGPVGFRTIRPSVAMTTKQILIAGKGEVNLKNDVAAGADSLRQTTFYTVITHPAPADDPTPALQVPLISNVVETGGDNEPTDTVTAKWTGVTFTNGVANEFGTPFLVPKFGEDVPAYVDRTHQWNGATPALPLPSYLVGGDYIMSGNDNRDNANYKLDITLSAPSLVYVLVDNRLSDGDGANPPDFSQGNMRWLVDNGWAAVRNGLNRAGNREWPDEVGVDEGGDGVGPGVGINQYSSVYVKSFPAGVATVLQADNGGRNMYGVVITPAPTGGPGPGDRPVLAKPTITANTLSLSWTGGGKLQSADSITGPWTDVAGNPSGSFSGSITGMAKFYRVVRP